MEKPASEGEEHRIEERREEIEKREEQVDGRNKEERDKAKRKVEEKVNIKRTTQRERTRKNTESLEKEANRILEKLLMSGISYPPDWGERTFSIRDEDETELRSI